MHRAARWHSGQRRFGFVSEKTPLPDREAEAELQGTHPWGASPRTWYVSCGSYAHATDAVGVHRGVPGRNPGPAGHAPTGRSSRHRLGSDCAIFWGRLLEFQVVSPLVGADSSGVGALLAPPRPTPWGAGPRRDRSRPSRGIPSYLIRRGKPPPRGNETSRLQRPASSATNTKKYLRFQVITSSLSSRNTPGNGGKESPMGGPAPGHEWCALVLTSHRGIREELWGAKTWSKRALHERWVAPKAYETRPPPGYPPGAQANPFSP